MLEEEAGVIRNAMTTRAPCGAKKLEQFNSWFQSPELLVSIHKQIRSLWSCSTITSPWQMTIITLSCPMLNVNLPLDSSPSKVWLSRKWRRPRFLPKTMGSMFECVTKVCRTQNSVSKTLVKAHLQNAYCDEKCLHRSQRNWRIDDKGRHWKKYLKR